MTLPKATASLDNARVELVRDSRLARIFRVFPDNIKRPHLGGQYGSLGLPSNADPAVLVKRPYSISCSMIDSSGRLLDFNRSPYHEFYVNRVQETGGREQLTPKLFALRAGDRIYSGEKITGHCTLARVPKDRALLLISTTTGEAVSNTITTEALLADPGRRIANLVLGPSEWKSLYDGEHATLMRHYTNYRFLSFTGLDLVAAAEEALSSLLKSPEHAVVSLGFDLDATRCHVFIVGDPAVIGAPRKLGGFAVEKPDHGLLRLLEPRGFAPQTRFQEGQITHESYW